MAEPAEYAYPGSPYPYPYIYSGGVMTNIRPTAGVFYANDINDLGQIVGFADIDDHSYSRPFLYSNGSMVDLGFEGSAESINNNGQIVGRLASGTAFFYENGAMTDLGVVWGIASGAYSINTCGRVAAPPGARLKILPPPC